MKYKGTSWNGTPSTYFGSSLLDQNLKPETSDAWEIGTYLRFFNNRIGFDFAYYQSRDYNNLIYSPISETSGYNSLLLNGDVYKRKGVEFTLDFAPVRNDNFKWDTQINLSQYRRYQEEIYGGKEQTQKVLLQECF